jgi:hypothetical protein
MSTGRGWKKLIVWKFDTLGLAHFKAGTPESRNCCIRKYIIADESITSES